MSLLSTLNLVGGLLSLPINEGDVVEISSNQGTVYGKIKRLGNNSMTVRTIESLLAVKGDKVTYKSNVTLDVDDIYSILQY